MAQVLETAGGKGFLSDADDDALEAITCFVQGIEATCSDECNLDKSQVRAAEPCNPPNPLDAPGSSGRLHPELATARKATVVIMLRMLEKGCLVAQLAEVAKLLASARRVGSVQDAYYVLSGLSLLTSTGKLPKPVAISLPSASVPSSSVSLS